MAQLAGNGSNGFADAATGTRSKGDTVHSHQDPGADAGPSDNALDALSAALRYAYDATVDEAIPASIMDLLNKLD